MFRVSRESRDPRILRAALGLLIAIVAATGLNLWTLAEVRKEQAAFADILQGGVAQDIQALGTLPYEVEWQFFFTILVLLVLVVAAIVLVLIVRAYLNSQQSLHEVMLLAWDILASMDQGVITLDTEGLVTSVNPSGQHLLGMSADWYGRPLRDVCSSGERLARASREVLASGTAQDDVACTVMLNGHAAQLNAECHTLRGTDDAIRGTVLHVRDWTERIFMEERMRRMERFMGLGSLAAGLHHEIRNPLSALSLHVQLLEERLADQADEEVAQNLSVIKTEVDRIIGVLESFRDFASIDRLQLAKTDPTALLQQMLDLVRPRAQQQQVEIRFSPPSSPLPALEADRAKLEQVLLNLIVNALEAMPTGGLLTVSLAARDGRVVLDLADTGRGIPENIRSRIFDPYFTTKSQGSGMGLAYCDKIIRQHGGQIDVETSLAGTTIHVSLPTGSPPPIPT